MNYHLEVDHKSQKNITFSQQLYSKQFDQFPKTMKVRGGTRECKVDVSFDSGLAKDTIRLSKDVFDDLLLPYKLPYDVVLKQNELKIGPVIGLILEKQDRKLSSENLKKYLNYTHQYSTIKGLLFIASVKGINREKKLIRGYYFNPYAKKGKKSWIKGVFPYPDVIYLRAKMGESLYQSLIKEMGNKIFNYPCFNKQKAWEWLSPVSSIGPYLPQTCPLRKPADFFSMMNKYPQVYLKLTNKSNGIGLIKVMRKKDGYLFQYNNSCKRKVFRTESAVRNFIKQLLAKNPHYLIQESIDLLQYNKRKIDFRFIMQKDHTQQWKCTGVIARFGKKGNIDTNVLRFGNTTDVQRYGYICSFEKALKRSCNLKEKKIKRKKKEIIKVCRKVCRVLDKRNGCYGDFGIDIALDRNLNIWIIEVNNRRHSHDFPLDLNAKKMHKKVTSRPILYAKALAGF